MSSHSAFPGFEERVRDSFGQQHFMTTLGADVVTVSPGEATIIVPADTRLTQQHGYIHAGVITSIADTACGYAAYSLMPDGHEVLSVEFKLNLMAPAVGDSLVARARVVRPGRTLNVCQADVFALQGNDTTQVATMLATIIGRPAREGRGS